MKRTFTAPHGSALIASIAAPLVLLCVFVLGACGGNSLYIEQMRMVRSEVEKMPYVASGHVEGETVVMGKLEGHGGSFAPPRPTENFPRIWGDTGIAQPQAPVYAPVQEYVQVQYQAPVQQAPAQQSRPANRTKLAVMEIEDLSGKLGKAVMSRGTDYLRATLNATRAFIVIDKSRQAEALLSVVAREKSESYKDCYDQSCQIPLGQALAADTILRTQITTIAKFCTISSELVDLEKEAAVGGGLVKFDCTEDGLSTAIEQLVPQITGGY